MRLGQSRDLPLAAPRRRATYANTDLGLCYEPVKSSCCVYRELVYIVHLVPVLYVLSDMNWSYRVVFSTL